MTDPSLTGPDVEALLAGAKRPERTVPVCLRGDLIAEMEQLERDLERAVRSDRISSPAGVIADRIEQLRDQMREHTLVLRFRALGWQQWADLETAHPPRKDSNGGYVRQDGRVGFDVDAVIAAAVPLCIVDPAMTRQQIDQLLAPGTLTNGQYQEIANAIWELNAQRVTVPFSALALASRVGSGESSKPPEPGVSAGDGSSAGNPSGPPGTSTTSTGG